MFFRVSFPPSYVTTLAGSKHARAAKQKGETTGIGTRKSVSKRGQSGEFGQRAHCMRDKFAPAFRDRSLGNQSG